jgi:hypothetical protein
MKRDDIVYNAAMYGAKYQATVKMVCLANQEFAGELCDTEKAAHQSAAYQALVSLKDEFSAAAKRAGTELPNTPGKVRKVDEEGASGLDVQIKTRVHEMLKQILGRDLIQNDTIYEYFDVPTGGHTCTIKFSALPGQWSQVGHTGPISPFKRDSMLLACKETVEALLVDPTYAGKIDVAKLDQEEKDRIQYRTTRDAAKKAAAQQNQARWQKGSGKGKWDMLWNLSYDDLSWMLAMKGKGGKGKGK